LSEYYSACRGWNSRFIRQYLVYFSYSIVTAAAIFYITAHSYLSIVNKDGMMDDEWTIGFITISSVVFSHHLWVWIEMKKWDWIAPIPQFLSFAIYWIIIALNDVTSSAKLFHQTWQVIYT
jgi:hypothetical protein